MSAPAQYLEPVSSDAPCGDVTSVGNMWQIDGLFAPSGGDLINWKPDWKEVTKVAERLLPNCKHVKLALVYTGMALQQDGLPGFRDGLSLLKEWLERYWDTLYPQLDKELVDPYEQMLDRIQRIAKPHKPGHRGHCRPDLAGWTTICRSRSSGTQLSACGNRSRLDEAGRWRTGAGWFGDTPMTAGQLDTAFRQFREAEPDQLAAQIQALKESQEILGKIGRVRFREGRSRTPSRARSD